MKNIKINHEFTLKEILENILEVVQYGEDFKGDRERMIAKITEYLGMIK